MGINPVSLCEGCLEPGEFRAPMQLNMIKVICRTRQEIRLIKRVGLPTPWYKPGTQLTTSCLKLLLLSYDGAKYDESDSQNTTGDTTAHLIKTLPKQLLLDLPLLLFIHLSLFFATSIYPLALLAMSIHHPFHLFCSDWNLQTSSKSEYAKKVFSNLQK